MKWEKGSLSSAGVFIFVQDAPLKDCLQPLLFALLSMGEPHYLLERIAVFACPRKSSRLETFVIVQSLLPLNCDTGTGRGGCSSDHL